MVAGCGGGKSVEGKWTTTGSASLPPGATVVTTFAGGDKLTMTMDVPQDLPDGKKINIHADVTGTYKLEGEKMSMKADDVKFSGTGFPPELKTAFDTAMADMAKQTKEQINKEGSVKFAWVDDDTFTLTGKDGKPETFKRMK